ncbi:LOW QUALITY PROTEIN: coagulation factor XIII B chain [Pelecanus crispus]|uniref:LOW QUALITY PROTEIN: coagulation factor XIII B chain n=1 Tax=Pelecanus crispus TaxID=36300 RepID=UPI003F5D44FD
METVMKMRFKSCFFFLVTMYSGKLFAEGKPCDLPYIENGKIAQYYYNFKSYYFPMHKKKKLSYSCMVGYTTEAGTQNGRVTCTAEGWSPVPQCYKKCNKPLLENGFFYGTEMYFKIHEKLQYKCNPGYHTPSGGTEDTVQCQPEGWSSQPSCTKKLESCQVPNLQHGSYFTVQQEFQLNETLLYKCDEGYHTAGGNTTEEAVCLTHGWSLTPNCAKMTCSSLSAIAHGGFYPMKKIYEEGDVVHFFCEENYSVTEFDLIQCYYFGWHPDPPVCEAVKNKCPPPPLPPHAHIITVRRTYHNGDKVRIQCPSTFEIRGSEEIQCDKGKWTSPPICIGTMDKWESEAPSSLEADAAIRASKTYRSEDMKMQQDCTSPPVIKNGGVLGPLLTSYKNGSSVEYGCQHYHFLDGPSTVYCKQGNWTEQPTCLEPCTLNRTDMNSNNIELKWRQEELIFLHGDLVEFECKQGYNFLQTTIPSPGRTQCNHGRLKYPKCIMQAPTEKCDSPPSIANGALTLPPLTQYDSGSSVQYSCSDYHFLQGSERIYCSEGQWTSPPVCIEPCTLSKNEMEKNNVLLQEFYENQVYLYHGDYVGFYCKQNHIGAESGTTLFQVQCKRGQLIRTESVSTCANAAAFDSTTTQLAPKRGAETADEFGRGFVAGPFVAPEHHATCRVSLLAVQGGGRRQAPLQKELCQTLHRYAGGEKVLQRAASTSAVDKRGKGGPCGPPPVIENGDLLSFPKKEYPRGTVLEYKCPSLYVLEGSQYITCTNGQWTRPPVCLVACTASEEDMERNNIELKWVRGAKLYSKSGDFVEFQCKRGYKEDPASSPFRAQCIEGTLEYPRCTSGDVRCGAAPEIPHASITSAQQERYLPGARVQYECERNFQMMGRNYVTCRNGEWSEAPICRDVTCEPPPEIAGGKVQGVKKSRYLPGESARYQCWQGFEMTGAATVACENGAWTEVPKCQGKGGPCGPPPVIENGDLLSSLKQEYPRGTVLEYKCPSLYVLEGSQYITCTNGQWTRPPVCLVACTASEEDMERNNIELKWVRGAKLYSKSGDFVEFQCKRGYKEDPASSPFRAQCIEGTLEYPRCTSARNCTVHDRIMNRNSIQLHPSSRLSTSTYHSGDCIFFECKVSYQQVSQCETFRAQCLNGVIKYPRGGILTKLTLTKRTSGLKRFLAKTLQTEDNTQADNKKMAELTLLLPV